MSEQLRRRESETKYHQTIKNHHGPKLLPISGHDIHTVRRLSYRGTNLFHVTRILPTILSKIYNPLLDYNIEGYFRYVRDILIAYNKMNTNRRFLGPF